MGLGSSRAGKISVLCNFDAFEDFRKCCFWFDEVGIKMELRSASFETGGTMEYYCYFGVHGLLRLLHCNSM